MPLSSEFVGLGAGTHIITKSKEAPGEYSRGLGLLLMT